LKIADEAKPEALDWVKDLKRKGVIRWERTHPCVLDAERSKASTKIQVDSM
jgi:hypothetical protein